MIFDVSALVALCCDLVHCRDEYIKMESFSFDNVELKRQLDSEIADASLPLIHKILNVINRSNCTILGSTRDTFELIVSRMAGEMEQARAAALMDQVSKSNFAGASHVTTSKNITEESAMILNTAMINQWTLVTSNDKLSRCALRHGILVTKLPTRSFTERRRLLYCDKSICG